jgi:hypothetical protein
VTEYSQSDTRGHGSFPEGAAPTPSTGARPPAETQPIDAATDPPPTAPTGSPPAAPPGSPSGTSSAARLVNSPAVPTGSSHPGSGAAPSYGPFHSGGEPQEGWIDTPYGFSSPPGRRIEPSPPPQRSRLLLGLAAGLVTGLLLFGAGGFLAGRATAPAAAPERPTG